MDRLIKNRQQSGEKNEVNAILAKLNLKDPDIYSLVQRIKHAQAVFGNPRAELKKDDSLDQLVQLLGLPSEDLSYKKVIEEWVAQNCIATSDTEYSPNPLKDLFVEMKEFFSIKNDRRLAFFLGIDPPYLSMIQKDKSNRGWRALRQDKVNSIICKLQGCLVEEKEGNLESKKHNDRIQNFIERLADCTEYEEEVV